jgi:mono/diheme cytochrome c family protein
MLRRLGLTLAAIAALTLGASVAAAPATKKPAKAAAPAKARTIAELVARYDSSSCIECHQDAHDQWAQSVHARSIFGTGRTAATFKTAVVNGLMQWPHSGVKSPKDVKVEHLMGCAKCHLPQLADATDAVAQEILGTIDEWQAAIEEDDEARIEKATTTLKSLNINCLICHQRNAITHKWTDGSPVADAVYGSQTGEHPDPKFPNMARSPIMGEAILCGQCHGLGPNLELPNPTQCATGYGSYLFAYIPEGGDKVCQQCHMRDSGLGHNMQSYRSKVMAEKAVSMHVEARGVVWRDNRDLRPKASVKIELTNHAGHGVPDG